MVSFPHSDEPPVLDVTTTDRLRQLQNSIAVDDENVILELVRIFERDSVRYLEQLESGLRVRDAEAAHRALHALKGASLSVGAHRVSLLVSALENVTKERGKAGLDDVKVACPRLYEEIPRALEALTALGNGR